ncbi:hypothetical protein AB0395_20975 [Streptosporangium sp. NPDC051023]
MTSGTLNANRVAGDDNPLTLMRPTVAPLARPPSPVDCFARL